MQRMGMVIGVQPDMVETCKELHRAVWPEILDLISRCNIRNYSIFLKEPETSCLAIGNITASTLRQTWRKWLPTKETRNGGRSASRAKSLARRAAKVSGGR